MVFIINNDMLFNHTILEKLRNMTSNSFKYLIVLVGVVIVSILVSYSNVKIGRYMFECALYIFAYYYSFNEKKYSLMKIKSWIFIVVIFISMIIRTILKKYIDNTIIYTNFVVLFTQSVIAISIFFIIKKMKFDIKGQKIISYINNLDEVTFYIYIVHYAFCVRSN